MLRGLKWVGLVLALLIAVAALAPWRPALVDQMTAKPYRQWAEANVRTLDLDAPDAKFAFDEAFYDNRLILMGELHGTADPHVLDLALIRHLRERAGLQWLMAELDFAQSTLVNFYLMSGEEKYLAPIFEHWAAETAQWASNEYYEKLRGLRAYNQALAPGERIRVFGVDRIQSVDVALDVLKDYMEAQDFLTVTASTDGTAPDWAAMLAPAFAEGAGEEARLGAVNAALFAAETLPASVRDKGFVHLLRNLAALDEGATRYETILANIAAMTAVFGVGDDEPLYGFWGLFHATRAPVNGTSRPLALRLYKEGPFAGSVGTISFLYTNSASMMPSASLPEPMRGEGAYTDMPFAQNVPYLYYQRGIYDLTSVAGDARASLFRISGEGSPYAGSGRLGSATGLMTGLGEMTVETADPPPYDYIILSQGSAALTPYVGD
ncbi:MAG: hypothetical protein AAFR11_09970 [Pseudomonadota bacterium]